MLFIVLYDACNFSSNLLHLQRKCSTDMFWKCIKEGLEIGKTNERKSKGRR